MSLYFGPTSGERGGSVGWSKRPNFASFFWRLPLANIVPNFQKYILVLVWEDFLTYPPYKYNCRITFICPMRFNSFPMDVQVCTFQVSRSQWEIKNKRKCKIYKFHLYWVISTFNHHTTRPLHQYFCSCWILSLILCFPYM